MTDRVRSLTIALEADIRTDDIESLIKAIQHLKGVLKVGKNITKMNDWTTETRIRHELAMQLYKLAGDFAESK